MIRLATLADIPIIRQIAQLTWPIAYREILSSAQLAYMLDLMYSESALHDQLVSKGHRFLLAENARKVVGFAGFEHHYNATAHTRLHKLYVLPTTQRSGAGSALLREVLVAAAAVGDSVLELNVNRCNSAKDFYLHHGFHIVREEVIPIGQGYVMDDYVLSRSTFAR